VTPIGNQLIHTCTIEQRDSTEDRHGNREPSWRPYLTSQRCRLVIKEMRALNTITAELIVKSTYKLLLPMSVEVQAGLHRVNGITLEDGELIDHIFSINGVVRRRGGYTRLRRADLSKVT
jgi:hypothetical protein